MPTASGFAAVTITPNSTGLPGIGEAETLVGALLTFGLIAACAGLAISAIAWAIGHHSGNPSVAGRGKTGVMVACGAALLLGGANVLIAFFTNAGTAL